MKTIALLLIAVPVSAHTEGHDHGLHHAIPALIGIIPILKVMWDNRKG